MSTAPHSPYHENPALETTNELLADDTQVTYEDLERISTELWGSPCYGETAVEGFQLARRRCVKEKDYAESDASSVYCSVAGFSGIIGNVPATPVEEQLLEAKIQQLWQAARPFAPKIKKSEAEAARGCLSWVLRPDDITTGSLARYLVHNRYNEHGLQGALGKMFDVMNVAAGLKTPETLTPYAIQEYIEYKNLRAAINRSDLSHHGKSEIVSKLRYGVAHQLETGQPYPLGEIIVEGFVTLKSGAHVPYGKVALSSLAGLAGSFRNEAIKEFLNQFR